MVFGGPGATSAPSRAHYPGRMPAGCGGARERPCRPCRRPAALASLRFEAVAPLPGARAGGGRARSRAGRRRHAHRGAARLRKTLLGVEIIRLGSRPSSSRRTQRCRPSGCTVGRSAVPGASRRPIPRRRSPSSPTRRCAGSTTRQARSATSPGGAGPRSGQRPRTDAGRGRGRGGDLDRRGRARRDRELARITAALKREVARGEHGRPRARASCSRARRARALDALRAAGVGTVVLDECHHLASLWGYVVRAVVEELGDVHVVGLTATPPDRADRRRGASSTTRCSARSTSPCRRLPSSASGYLAPYQELAWLTEPLDGERALARRARPALPRADHRAARRRRERRSASRPG